MKYLITVLLRKTKSFLIRPRIKHWKTTAGQVLPWAMLLVAIGFSAVLIFNGDGAVPRHPMDQSFAENVDLSIYHNGNNWVFQYPTLSWSGGISGSLMVGIYKMVVPTLAGNLNWHVKIFSVLLFLAGLFWLGRSYSLPPVLQTLSLALAATSGLLYLEPSTEVLAGAMCCMFFATLPDLSRRPGLPAAFLAMFSLMKIELLPIGIALACLSAWSSHTDGKVRGRFMAAFGVFLFFLLAPSLYFKGLNTFTGRGISAFGQHYCALMTGRFDAAEFPDLLPNVDSVMDVIFRYPKEYLWFVVKSAIESAEHIIVSLNLLALAPLLFIFRLFRLRKGGKEWVLYAGATVIFLLTVAASIAFAYVHPRYMTRSLGVFIVGLLTCIQQARSQDWCRKIRFANIVELAIYCTIIGLNLLMLPGFLAAPHYF